MKLNKIAMFVVGAVATGNDRVRDLNLTNTAMSAVKKSYNTVKSIDVKKIQKDAATYIDASKKEYVSGVGKAAEYVAQSKEEFAAAKAEKAATKSDDVSTVISRLSEAQLRQLLEYAVAQQVEAELEAEVEEETVAAD
jgi:hypothetical protein